MQFNENYFNELGTSPPVEAVVVGTAEQVASVARNTAPVFTGEYKNNIEVRKRRTGHRVVAEVVATSDHSMLVESTTGNLSRALRAVTGGG